MGDIVRRGSAWYVRYKDADGKRKMRASHQPSKELARRYLLEVEGRIARGQVGIPEPPPAAPTVAELVERFLAEYSRPRIKDLAKYRAYARTALRRALPLVGTRPADHLQPADVARLREALTRAGANNSVRLTLSFLSATYAWAVKAQILVNNPFRGVDLPPRQDLIEYLSRDEVHALLTLAARNAAGGGMADRMLHTALVLALHLGLRKGELMGLRWQDLDLDSRRLTVARSYRGLPKGGKPRPLRLPVACVPLLSAWRKECPRTAEGLVFPKKHRAGWGMETCTAAMMGLPELLVAAGCRPMVRAWHALRHTFASHFIMSGGNLLALQKILGHCDVKVTMVYAHLGDDFLATEVDRLKF